jgi:hypothetical protein
MARSLAVLLALLLRTTAASSETAPKALASIRPQATGSPRGTESENSNIERLRDLAHRPIWARSAERGSK